MSKDAWRTGPSRRAAFFAGAMLFSTGFSMPAFAAGGHFGGDVPAQQGKTHYLHLPNSQFAPTGYGQPSAHTQNYRLKGQQHPHWVGFTNTVVTRTPRLQQQCGGGTAVVARKDRSSGVTTAPCPKPGQSPSPIPPPYVPVPYIITQSASPAFFNGCQTNPAQGTVMNITTPQVGVVMRVAPGEPPHRVVIQPPTQDGVILGGDATEPPWLPPGHQLPPSGQPAPEPTIWYNLQLDSLIGQRLTGPMWAVWSRKEQQYRVTYHPRWNGRYWTYFTTTAKVGTPVWSAGESYDVTACPMPLVQFKPNPTIQNGL